MSNPNQIQTIQFGLGADMPLTEGGTGADEPVWYFDEPGQFNDAVTLLLQHRIEHVTDRVPTVPEGEVVSDYDEFKEYVSLELMARARRDEPEH